MDDRQNIIEKIQKCIRLSINNPSAEEAETAALMAQRLMARYHIEVVDLGGDEQNEEIVEYSAEMPAGMRWKGHLANAVADNFRCRAYLMGHRSVVFFGLKVDAAAAKEIFVFLFTTGHKLARSAANRATYLYGSNKGVYNSFVLGFVAGVRSKLEKQCRALMIVTPPKVVEDFEAMAKEWKAAKSVVVSDLLFDHDAYHDGFNEGRYATDARSLA